MSDLLETQSDSDSDVTYAWQRDADPDVLAGDWWLDTDGRLYIVPVGFWEPIGPANDAMDDLVLAYRDFGHAGDVPIDYDLRCVPLHLRCWNWQRGYFVFGSTTAVVL